MKTKLFVHIQAQLLPARMPFLLNRKLQPEIGCQEVDIDELDLVEMSRCATQLVDRELGNTVHAPFADFKPGSSKKQEQKKAHTMCQQSLQLASALRSRLVVFHPGIPYQATSKQQNIWLENCLTFWPEYIKQAEQRDLIITIENIYEPSADIFLDLFKELGSANFGHCFDVGHCHMFTQKPLDDWFAKLSPYIHHLHLHDNHGQCDEHLPIGAGHIDFPTFFANAKKLPKHPSMTLESHSIPELEDSLAAVQIYLD